MRRITKDQRRRCIELRVQEQLSTPAIARRVGICNQAVYRILEKHPWTGETMKGGSRATWTMDEVRILTDKYPTADQDEIVAALPRRKWESIAKKASALNLRRRQPGSRKNKRHVARIIEQLRQARESRGRTRAQVADLCGYHLNQILAWELGKAIPAFNRFCDWASALGFDVVLQPKLNSVRETTIAPPSRERLMGTRA